MGPGLLYRSGRPARAVGGLVAPGPGVLHRGPPRLRPVGAACPRVAFRAPLPPGATLAFVDEHEAADKPRGPPRLHSRDVVLERVMRGRLAAALTAATPSVETWWRADSGRARLVAGDAAPWPAVQLADTRGILKVEPLTPPLARGVREALAAGRRALLVVSRLTSAL